MNADPPKHQGQQGSDSAPGSLGDAVNPFTDALVAAAKTAGEVPPGDRAVSSSLQLGWLLEDILNGRERTPYPSDLALPAGAGYVAQALQLKTLLPPLKLDDSADPKTVIDKLTSQSAATAEAATWQPKLAGALVGADIRFAKAYGVGRHLNALANAPATAELFSQPPVNAAIAALDDLSTALPPHAARGVANSIRRWQALAPVPADGTLFAQCVLWRAILTGEKKATELLEPENFLDAAERLSVKLRATATDVLKQYVVWVVLIAVLFVAGVCVLVFAPKHAGTTAAGLSGVLAALGLTWKGIGGTLGKLGGKLEAPLWGAEVDGAVTDAVTLVHVQLPAKSVQSRRRDHETGDYANRAARAKLSPTAPAGRAPVA